MKILVINAGSSSLKYQLIDMDSSEVMAKGLCERIGIDGSRLKHTPAGKDAVIIEKPMKNHADAINMVIAALTDGELRRNKEHGRNIGNRSPCSARRRYISKSVIITDEVKGYNQQVR